LSNLRFSARGIVRLGRVMHPMTTLRAMPRRAGVALWLLAAALAGSALAGPAEDLAAAEVLYGKGDYAAVLRLIRPLAEQGNARAQYNLATMYARGAGVPQDQALAVEWYRKAADQGSAPAQHNLGAMYVTGRGVPQNFAEGAKWLRKAADQGDGVAQYNLAVMYEQGQGVPQDYVQAWKWFSVAATRFAGDAEKRDRATKGRDRVAARLTPAQLAEATRQARGWKPAG
jgi:TPR repeat protein